MRSKLILDQKKRNFLKKNELNLVTFKFLLFNFRFLDNKAARKNLILLNFFHFFFKNNSYTRLNNYCRITGRSRGILRDFKISRLTFKKLASRGLISGLHRASW